MSLYAFYLARGWKFEELSTLSFIEKTIMHHAADRFYEEQQAVNTAAINRAFSGKEA